MSGLSSSGSDDDGDSAEAAAGRPRGQDRRQQSCTVLSTSPGLDKYRHAALLVLDAESNRPPRHRIDANAVRIYLFLHSWAWVTLYTILAALHSVLGLANNANLAAGSSKIWTAAVIFEWVCMCCYVLDTALWACCPSVRPSVRLFCPGRREGRRGT